MSTSVGEPFILSSYALPQKINAAEASSSSVYASYSGRSKNDGMVTLAVQGDGVHIVDLDNLNPVSSHTLGPSTSFSCPAVSQTVAQDSQRNCTTYAAIQVSSDIPQNREESTIWLWDDDLESSSGGSRQKVELLVPHPISQLFVSEELTDCVLAVSSKGSVSVVGKDGKVSTRQAPADAPDVYKFFVYPGKSCSFFAAHSTPPSGAIVAALSFLPDRIQLSLLAYTSRDTITDAGTHTLLLAKEGIIDASLSSSGLLSLLYNDGSWYGYQLEQSTDLGIEFLPVAPPLQLDSSRFVSGPNSVSLLAVRSSYVLLAGITSSSPREIALLIWDLQYSILLASNSLAIPSTLIQSKDVVIRLALSLAENHALLTLSPFVRSSSRKSSSSISGLRSSVFAIPFSTPLVSTIASAIGHNLSGARWLKPTVSSDDTSDTAELLTSMQAAMDQGKPQAASDAFFAWKGKQPVAADATLASEVLSHAFVKDILSLILPSTSPNSPYPSGVVKYLLGQGSISASMVEGGFMTRLRPKGDWDSIMSAFKTVVDLTESDIIATLGYVTSQSRSSGNPDAMQLDSTYNGPHLETFLASCIRYPMTAASLRLALRETFTHEDDVCAILLVIEGWLSGWSEEGVSTHQPTAGSEVPPLDKVLSFLIAVVDATFVNLLQHQPSHQILKAIMSDIEVQLTLVDDLVSLCGPLEAFSKAQAKAAQEAKEGKGKQASQTEWMRKRRHAHEQTGMAVGAYRLEELVI
ncbi:hypothetical protein ONZ45_g15004 [Pleurotus djamor]|nr:hypothetical protein ONZ45_g15004 [Pleurotus djamor]